jgi:hypothetical protein
VTAQQKVNDVAAPMECAHSAWLESCPEYGDERAAWLRIDSRGGNAVTHR